MGCKEPKKTLRSFILRENIIEQVHKKELCFQAVAASVKDMRPFNLTKGSGVVDLVLSAWNIGAKVGIVSKGERLRALPCPTTVSRNVNQLAKRSKDSLKSQLKAEMNAGTSMALTTDIWSDKYKHMSYFCITIHYFDQNQMKLVDFILALAPMESGRKKDHIYLQEIITDKFIEFDLLEHQEKLVFISDRGSNIRAALKHYTRLNCFPHFCNNIAKYGCQVESIKVLIGKCSALVKYFKANGLNNNLDIALKSAISTRFNYVFMMLSSIENQWDAIREILIQRHEIARMAGIDRDCIKELIKFLSSFNLASKVTEATYKETLAHVWIGITQLCSVCRVQPSDPIYIRAMKARCLEYIESKFVLHQYHRVATFLHPNYKGLIFCSAEQKRKAIRDTKSLLSHIQTPTPNQSPSSSDRSSGTSSNSSFLSNYYSRRDDDFDEVDIYMNMQWVAQEKMNVFNWWIERKSAFPNLFKLAIKMHSIPASSMQSERTFSKSGFTFNDRRSNLNPETVEDLILLNKNYDFEVRLNCLFFSNKLSLSSSYHLQYNKTLEFRTFLSELPPRKCLNIYNISIKNVIQKTLSTVRKYLFSLIIHINHYQTHKYVVNKNTNMKIHLRF